MKAKYVEMRFVERKNEVTTTAAAVESLCEAITGGDEMTVAKIVAAS